MKDTKHRTVYLSKEEMVKLQLISLQLTESGSVSELMRHIANSGKVVLAEVRLGCDDKVIAFGDV